MVVSQRYNSKLWIKSKFDLDLAFKVGITSWVVW